MREDFDKSAGKRRGRTQQHHVVLTKADIETLQAVIENPANDFQCWRAKVLLALDCGKFADGQRKTHKGISRELGISEESVYRTGKRFSMQGLQAVLDARATGLPFDEDDEKMLQQLVKERTDRQKDWSAREIARELGRSPTTICEALRRLDIDFH